MLSPAKMAGIFTPLGSSVEDFLGTNRFSAEELRMLAEKLQTVHDAWKKQGTEFIFLCAPNKEGIYSEYLPDDFKAPGESTRRSELIDYLNAHTSVPIIDPYPELKKRRDYQWYFKTDTHWNDAAGFLVSGSSLTPQAVPPRRSRTSPLPTSRASRAIWRTSFICRRPCATTQKQTYPAI